MRAGGGNAHGHDGLDALDCEMADHGKRLLRVPEALYASVEAAALAVRKIRNR